MIASIISKLASTTSRIEKIQILESHRDNDLLKRVFKMALDPNINYYIKAVPPYELSEFPILHLEQALDELEVLSSRKKTGHAAIAHLQWVLSNTFMSSEVVSYIIQRDLKCGVSEKTVNAVWKNLVPEFPCMLCAQFDQKLIDKLVWPVRAETKMDGGRVTIIHSSVPELYSRNGKPIEVAGNVFDQLSRLTSHYVYDGECLFVGDDGKYLDRKTSNGLFNKCIKSTASDEELSRMRFVLWDMIPINEFTTGKGQTHLKDRIAMLESTLHEIQSSYFRQVFGKLLYTMDDVMTYYQEKRDEGEEGIVIKSLTNVFSPKRVKDLIKVKAEHSIDVMITGWKEGTNKYEGLLGALEITTSDGGVTCFVGSGFSDAERSTIGPEVVGLIAEITYNDIIVDKRTGQKSFFLPIFQSIRLDKTVADPTP